MRRGGYSRRQEVGGRRQEAGAMQNRTPAQTFEELVVWQKSHQLVLLVYRLTAVFPKFELYALASQMRKAAVSVPANIAEGFKKRGRPDKARLMNIAQGSLEELRYYFLLSRDLGYLEDLERDRVDEIGRLLGAYTKALLAPAS
jgi:four helix bundle protein